MKWPEMIRRYALVVLAGTVLSAIAVADIVTVTGNGGPIFAIGDPNYTICAGAPAATTATTSEEVLATCPIPAGTIPASGATVKYSFYAHYKNNGNAGKEFIVRIGGIGGTIVYDSLAGSDNDKELKTVGPCEIRRTSATTATAQCTGEVMTNPGTIARGSYYNVRSAAVAWGGSLDLVFDGKTTAAAGDIILDSYSVEVTR